MNSVSVVGSDMIDAKAVAALRQSRQDILQEGTKTATGIHACVSRATTVTLAERHRRVAAGCAGNIGNGEYRAKQSLYKDDLT